MDNTDDFYSSGNGDKLIDSSKFPNEIKDYLSAEIQLLTSFGEEFDWIIEVGCMNGRYLDWAIKNSKRYLGVDVVERYIEDGKKRILSLKLSIERYQIKLCNAESTHELLSEKDSISRPFAILPFNSFGNMDNPSKVLNSFYKANLPFLICSYGIDSIVNRIRSEYYANCGYKNIKMISNDIGIRFVSDDGLYTIAFNPVYLADMFKQCNIAFEEIPFSTVGIAYKGIPFGQ